MLHEGSIISLEEQEIQAVRDEFINYFELSPIYENLKKDYNIEVTNDIDKSIIKYGDTLIAPLNKFLCHISAFEYDSTYELVLIFDDLSFVVSVSK